MPTFQYISDLHLEFYDEKLEKIKKFNIKSNADYLLLAGDIGNPYKESYKFFLKNVATKFKKVFIINGNHEYYGNSIIETDIYCRNLCKNFNNIIFLQNEKYCIEDNIYIIGSTLWSHIPNISKIPIINTIADYKKISEFTIEKNNELHEKAKESIINHIKSIKEENLNKDKEIKIIILTHHMPSLDLISEKYKCYSLITNAFASDVNINSEYIKAWVYGHTHEKYEDNYYYCNPIGYPGENKKYSLEEILIL